MPNWVSNELTVRGGLAEMAAFVDTVKGVDEDGDSLPLSLQVIDPMPEELASGAAFSDSEGPEHGWYSWARQHWGPKWEISGQGFIEFDVRPGGGEAFYRFDTAIGGVEPAVALLAKRYPSLQFDLRTQDEFSEEWDESQWRDGLLSQATAN